MEIAKPNQSTGKKETQSYTIEIDKFELKNASNNEYEVYKKAEKITKNRN